MVSEHVAAMLLQAAHIENEILEILETSPDSWRVRFADADVDLEFNAEAGRLYLFTDAGIVNAPERAVAYETMLSYNLLWRDTGDVRLGMTPERQVFLIAGLPVSDLTAELLADALPNVMTKARLWRAFLETGGGMYETVSELAITGIRV